MKFSFTLATILFLTFSLNAFANPITYEVEGIQYEGFHISSSPNAPLILLLHDWDGLTEYEIKRAQMLADMGYGVFAADLFGKGVRPTEIKDKRQHTGELYKDRDKMRSLLFAALETAKQQGGNTANAVAMGYCFGGAAVLEFARAGANLKGFVSFHGGLNTPKGQDYSQAKGKTLVFHGSADTNITLGQFAELARQLEAAKIPHEMTTYSGAPHAFTVFGLKKYREEADRQSWKRFTDFLNETLR